MLSRVRSELPRLDRSEEDNLLKGRIVGLCSQRELGR